MNDDGEVIPFPPHGRPPRMPIAETDLRMPCQWCQAPTLVAMLNHYGARCFSCYEAYCREPQPSPDVGDKRKDPRAWAHALKRRHEAGERLTPAQIDMYRAALGRGVTDAGEP